MGSMSPMHWLVVLAIALVAFGSGRVSSLMGDVAKGIKTFKKTMAEDTDDVSMEASAERRPPGTIAAPHGTAQPTAANQDPISRG